MLRRPRASSFETRFKQAKLQDDHVICSECYKYINVSESNPRGPRRTGGSGDEYELSENGPSLLKRGLHNERFGNHSEHVRLHGKVNIV